MPDPTHNSDPEPNIEKSSESAGYNIPYEETAIEDDAEPEPWDSTDPHKHVKWWNQAPGPAWEPYVIICVSFTDPFLTFRFHKPDGWGQKEHTLNIDERRLVWRNSPSVLRHRGGWIRPNEAGILFLSDKLQTLAPSLWEDGHLPKVPAKREGPGTGTGGGGKWPVRAGEGIHVLDQIRAVSTDFPPEKRAVIAELFAAIGAIL